MNKLKQWIFPETIVDCDLEVGRYRQLIQLIKIYEYLRLRLLHDLGPRFFRSKKPLSLFSTKICM